MGMWQRTISHGSRTQQPAPPVRLTLRMSFQRNARVFELPTLHSRLGNRFNQLAGCLISVHTRRNVGLRDDSAEHPVLVDNGNRTFRSAMRETAISTSSSSRQVTTSVVITSRTVPLSQDRPLATALITMSR